MTASLDGWLPPPVCLCILVAGEHGREGSACAFPVALGVEEEVKCPICHEYLTNAVSVDCGHNYCQTCILSHCRMKEHFGEEVTCPLCQAPIQRENIRPNWPLRNLVEKIKHFPLRLPKENLCRKHKEKLKPDVAYPWCILSSRLESVTRVWKIRDLPRNPERCDCTPFVLGSKAFTSGRHWWEVNTGAWGTLDWAVGVARDSLRKKPYVRLNPKEGVWAVGSIFNASASVCQLSALTFPKPSPLRVKKQPREIRVCLDYEAGLVEFFSADNNELIFMFHVESFSGEKIRPFFWNRKSSSTGIGQEVKIFSATLKWGTTPKPSLAGQEPRPRTYSPGVPAYAS
uniref:Uncharacterized protein n=1 Tax=Varanus komodoensis TaxID=61221 RepID=A0A8D2IXG3_VARKO